MLGGESSSRMPSGGGRCKQEPLVKPRKVHSAETKGRQEEGKIEPGTRTWRVFISTYLTPGSARGCSSRGRFVRIASGKSNVPSSATRAASEPSTSIIGDHDGRHSTTRRSSAPLACCALLRGRSECASPSVPSSASVIETTLVEREEIFQIDGRWPWLMISGDRGSPKRSTIVDTADGTREQRTRSASDSRCACPRQCGDRPVMSVIGRIDGGKSRAVAAFRHEC